MYYPDRKQFKKIIKEQGSNVVPVFADITKYNIDPISVFQYFEKNVEYSFILESAEKGEELGKYTFIGVNPFSLIKYTGEDKKFVIKENGKTLTDIVTEQPLDCLRDYMKKFKTAKIDSFPPFVGGAVGYVGYDVIRTVEDLPDMPEKDVEIPDIFFMVVDTVLVFDHLKNKTYVCVNAIYDNDYDEAYNEVEEKIKSFINEIALSVCHSGLDPESRNKKEVIASIAKQSVNEIASSPEAPRNDKREISSVSQEVINDDDSIPKSNFEKQEFENAVSKCKEYIKAGDILQVVISQRFEKNITTDSIDIYKALREINPSPYMFYLKFKDMYLIGSSPETMVKVIGSTVTTKPIAGTRKRGNNEDEDLALEKDLISDEKEVAEHLMLVDLGRNDIGKISKTGSVKLTEFMSVEKYSHVMHIVSEVEGELLEDCDIYDSIKSVFPAGTVSGAPKIRAMEIIDELEKTKRGYYAGLTGYISFTGDMDTCITIRTILCKDNIAYVQAGAGIVADSIPEKEYEETVNKAKGLMRAVDLAERRNCK